MSLKRKRDRKHDVDNNEFISPPKRQKRDSLTTSLNDVHLSPQTLLFTQTPLSDKENMNNEDIDIDNDNHHCLTQDKITDISDKFDPNTNELLTPDTNITDTPSLNPSPLNTLESDKENNGKIAPNSAVKCDDFGDNNILTENMSVLNSDTKATKRQNRNRHKIKNSIFWKEINEMSAIVPSPPMDLCDRHLLVMYTYPNTRRRQRQRRKPMHSYDITMSDSDKSDSDTESESGVSDTDSDIHGLDNDDMHTTDNKNTDLLAHTRMTAEMKALLANKHWYEYRLVKIANYALSIKSAYFRNLLSKKSQFQERNSNCIVINVSIFNGFVFELLLRLLHLNFNEIDGYLFKIEKYQTLIQMLVLTDKYQIKHIDSLILKRLKFMAVRDRPRPVNVSRKLRNLECIEGDIAHVMHGFNSDFDNGGMTLLEVSQMLLVSNSRKYVCFTAHIRDKIREIASVALRQRFTQLSFNEYGIVSRQFLQLPACAINIILKSHEFCSWNENDVFLACTQWVHYPLQHSHSHSQSYERDSEDTEDSDSECEREQQRQQRFGAISENIRYHLLDLWFIESIARHYAPLKGDNRALNQILSVCSKAALIHNESTDINAVTNRYKDVSRFLQKQKRLRSVPPRSGQLRLNLMAFGDRNKPQKKENWETFVYRDLTDYDRLRRGRVYDEFALTFRKHDLLNLSIGQRVTSRYLVWRGIIFALDLVRKGNGNNNGSSVPDSVGVFLYCQGIEYAQTQRNHIWIKYSLKTVDTAIDHALQCTDYKMMQLNFQKGNGSRDFFNCDWDRFLTQYFDEDDQISFILKFIDAK